MPPREDAWRVDAPQSDVCTALLQATLEAGYRLDGQGPTTDGGCALYVTLPVSATGYGHRSSIAVHDGPRGASFVQWSTRKRVSPNVSEPVQTMQGKVMARVRHLVSDPIN